MSNQLRVNLHGFDMHIDQKALERELSSLIAAEEVLKSLRERELNVVSIDIDHMAALNMEYREKVGSTDVLSFEIDESLSEIYVCVEDIKNHLPSGGDLKVEISRVMVHGMLHLIGMDHEGHFEGSGYQPSTDDVKIDEKMFVEQERLLIKLLERLNSEK